MLTLARTTDCSRPSPLESSKYVIANFTAKGAETHNAAGHPRQDGAIEHVEVHRANFYAKAKWDIYFEISREMQDGGVRQRERLRRVMYRQRAAASTWQDEDEGTLTRCIFVPGLA